MMDPDYCGEEPDWPAGGPDDQDDFYDTFDRIIDETELNADIPDPVGDSGLDPDQWGMAFALADEMAEEARNDYDLDEDTDERNMQEAMRLDRLQTQSRNLRPFEQIVDDICKGRRSLFDTNF